MKQTVRELWKLLVENSFIWQIDHALSLLRMSWNSHLLHNFLQRNPVLHLIKIFETVQLQIPDHTVADGRDHHIHSLVFSP